VFITTFNNISVILWQSFLFGGGKSINCRKLQTCNISLTIFYHMCNSDLGSLKCNWLHRDTCSNLIWWVQKTLLKILMCFHHCNDLKLLWVPTENGESSTHLDELQGFLLHTITFQFSWLNYNYFWNVIDYITDYI